MKKFFTLIAAVAMAASVNAQTTLIDFPTSTTGIAASGTCDISATVKIYSNKTSVSALKFSNGYTTDNLINENFFTLSTEGGFKTGDVVTIAGAFNNADDTKKSGTSIFKGAVGEEASVLFTTEQFINGRTNADDPKEESFTLTEDSETLKLGRSGNTATYITKLTVVRGSTSGINSAISEVSADADAATYNVMGQKVASNAKGLVIKNGKKFINK